MAAFQEQAFAFDMQTVTDAMVYGKYLVMLPQDLRTSSCHLVVSKQAAVLSMVFPHFHSGGTESTKRRAEETGERDTGRQRS